MTTDDEFHSLWFLLWTNDFGLHYKLHAPIVQFIVCFGYDAIKHVCCHTAKSSLLSQMPNHQICQRIWEEPPVLFSFIKMCKLFPLPLAMHWGTMTGYMIPACTTALNKFNDFLHFFFFQIENNLNELPLVMCAAFQSKTTERKVCDPGLFKANLHNCNSYCDCISWLHYQRFTQQRDMMCEFCTRLQPERTNESLKYLHCTL